MQKQSLLSLAIFLCVCGTTMAQGQQVAASSQLIQIDGSESGMTKTALFKKYFHLQASDALRPLRTQQDEWGYSHEKFRQYYRNVLVENATVTVHSKAGKVVSLSGNYSSVGNLNVKPTITSATAFQAAKAHVGAKHYRWEDSQNEHNTYQIPKGELVVLPDFSGKTPARLAYKFDIYASEPLYRAYVYIDAQTGKYLQENKRIHDVDVPATGVSLYDGNVSFTAQSFTDVYRLRQATTGGGVETYNLHNGYSYGSATDFTSATTSFTADHTGVEAHWCTEKTYNYYFSKHGRHSYDDADGVLKSYVHYGTNYVNAFWDGNAMTYGDGEGSITPLVTLDICGHEITHGVTEHSAGLIYSGESGALNESFSDIFGEAIENYGKGANNWLLASEIGEIIRYMNNPNADGASPDTYHGTYWSNGNDVHYNSGVQNKWFYIMTVGETGTNDLNDHYCVTGLGITKAAAIAYRNLTVYLSASSNYPAARNGAIQAAIDLYGADSPEVVTTTNAWHAVGVGAAFAPKITCPPNITVNNTPNQCSATVNYTAPVGIGNCPTTTRTGGGASGSSFAIGNTTVTYRVTDTDMTTSTCAFTIRVNDTQAPTITCPANTTVAAGAGCQATLGSYTALASATDNCPAVTVSQTPTSGTSISGTTTVTLRATDAANLTSTCTMTVAIIDNTTPTITCPANVTVAANGACQASLASYTGAASATDNCSTPTLSQLPVSGTTINSGVTTITLRATDASSQTSTCTMTVTVTDQTAPTITCPANVTIAANATCQALLGSYTGAAVAADNCSTPTLSQLPVSGTTINAGTSTVTLRATDAASLTSTCTMTVTVADQTAPTITCPANVTVTANASCQASLASYTTAASAADNCSTPTLSQLPVSGTIINAGVNTVTLRATDGAALTATCAITVTVVDQTPPTITCPANVTVAADAACQASLANYTATTTAVDNCSTPTKTQLPVSGTSMALGTTTVTMRATDGAALTATCIFTVTVTDQTAPTVVCKTATVNLSAAGTASITTASVFQSATDNCGIINQVSVTPSTFTCSNTGVNNVVLTVNDGHGNNGTCTAQVTVVDNIAPSMLCKNATINLNAAGSATVTTAQINNGSTDNCSIATLSLSKTTFSCSNIGANTVTLTGTDPSNNAASCQATVTVVDAIAPVALCKNATVQLTAAGTVTVPGSTVNNGSSDNCTFNLSLTPATFNCGNVGTNTVVMKATDAGGNTATCTAIITVQDKVAPTANCKNINVFLDNDGQASITAAQVNNGSSDACGIATASINITNFNCSNLPGSAVAVQLLLKDIYNNQSSCLAYVTVKELIAPVAICQDITVQLSAQGNVTVYPANLAADSYDNCSVWSYSPVAKVYTTANVGVNNLTITVKDWSNNASTCVSKVTVQPYNSNNNQADNRGGSPVAFTGTTDLRLYPNPTDGQLTIDFRLEQDETVQLRLFDVTGKLVMQQSVDGYQNDNTVHLDLGELPTGLYIVDFQSGTQREQKRLVIER